MRFKISQGLQKIATYISQVTDSQKQSQNNRWFWHIALTYGHLWKTAMTKYVIINEILDPCLLSVKPSKHFKLGFIVINQSNKAVSCILRTSEFLGFCIGRLPGPNCNVAKFTQHVVFSRKWRLAEGRKDSWCPVSQSESVYTWEFSITKQRKIISTLLARSPPSSISKRLGAEGEEEAKEEE